MEDVKNKLFTTPLMKVLELILENSDRELSDQDVAKEVLGVKRAAVHDSLVKLNNMGITTRTRRGMRCYNFLGTDRAWIHPLKAAINMMALEPLVSAIKDVSGKIILFGSRADGTNRSGSDFDLLVIAPDAEGVIAIASKSPLSDSLSLIIKTPGEMLDLESSELWLSEKIRKGVTLWER